MSDTKEKVNLLDVVPVQCGHITTEWEGECAVLSFPRFKYEWMRRFLLPKGMSADIHVKLRISLVEHLPDKKRKEPKTYILNPEDERIGTTYDFGVNQLRNTGPQRSRNQ